MSANISLACPGDSYAALCEHAWLRRQSIGALVRETLEAADLFAMPEGQAPSVGADIGPPSEQAPATNLLETLDD